jgi:hypothetical protein
MSATEMTLCVLCFQPVLGCSECADCDANRYCPGHYFLRARQQSVLHLEGGLFDGALSDSEFVRLMNQTVTAGTVQTFSTRARSRKNRLAR